MTHDPHSADLDRIKSLLAKSLDAGEGEDTPPLPEGLRDRIKGQYGRTATAPTQSNGFFAMLSQWFAQPAFAGAAAALVLLVAAIALFNQGDTEPVFRGDPAQVETTTIILFQVDEATTTAIRESGYFDEKALRSIQSPEELKTIAPPTIVIDGSSATIISQKAGEAEPTTIALPTDPAQLPDILADLLRDL